MRLPRAFEALTNAGVRNSLARLRCIWLAELHAELACTATNSSLGRFTLLLLSQALKFSTLKHAFWLLHRDGP